MSSDLKTRVNLTAKGAEEFTQLYYKHLDTQRQMLSRFYRPQSTILWNGNAFIGGDSYAEFMSRFPPTVHEVQSFDCHPVDSGMLSGAGVVPGEAPSMILVVSGSVKFGEEREKRGFSESFLLKADGDVFFVANHVNRLIYKPS